MLEGNYEAEAVEKKWQERWAKEGTYRFHPEGNKPVFSIDTPPPTVSGNMHIGHAFSYSQQDFIARYKRMKGFNVYYPFGTDDNGLPTERLVEKLRKVKSTRMDRPSFVKLCRETIKEIKDDFVSDWLRIGMSCDFTNIYSTIDPHCVKTSQKSFIDLHKKGLVEKRKAPSMWCVNCQTAIAQAELEDKDLSSSFNDITFTLEDGKKITIATTRPELLPACVCIFVHPSDERCRNLVGKKAIVPLFEQEVEIFADESAEPEKGSGIMMICSYGDRFDVDAINRKHLAPRICITHDGRMNELAKQFAGMPIKEARAAILAELEKHGMLTAKKSISHTVNVHDKCQTEIEFLASEQWFIKVIENKDKFIAAGNQIKWHPDSMRIRYENWVKNLNWDWCVSRQRHFGVPFPVWYSKKTGETILADESQLPVDPLSDLPKHLPHGHTKDDIIPEKDVMDTWATSSMTPQIITNWVGDSSGQTIDASDFRKYYPTSLRPQGHDIIRTWAFYTIVKGVYHQEQIPWDDIIISGNVADPKGEKMSKSKGNVVDPRAIITKYCGDALRFWAAGSKLGEDLAYQEKDFVTGKKTITKLWNAAKLCYQHLEDYRGCDPGNDDGDNDKSLKFEELEIMDQWLMLKFNETVRIATEHFDAYNFSEARKAAEQFFWHDFCDNYLEVVKNRLYDKENRQKERLSAQHTLYHVFLGILKLFAPAMPYITEELYHSYYSGKDKHAAKSIHISGWPEHDDRLREGLALEAGELAISIISEVRKHKAARSISMKQEIESVTAETSLELEKLPANALRNLRQDIISTINSRVLEIGKGPEQKITIG